ncbi:MAG TPA: condensation domain-containing protein, partial [Steroidobacteraceae bacterium]|nr:condensation domain-containing protein [Steroidobacteraceae bacterium]
MNTTTALPVPTLRPQVRPEDLNRAITALGGKRNVADVYPLAPLQQGILFHSVYAGASALYVAVVRWRLTGALDGAVFNRAWRYLMERHTILRTAFTGQDVETPLQIVVRSADLPMTYWDWHDVPAVQAAEQLDKLVEDERNRSFDLTRPPLFRVTLVKLADHQHELIWSSHHLLLDGWSQPVVMRELFAVYDAFLAGKSPQLSSARPYRDYIAWLQRQDISAAEKYWQARLAGFNEPTPLPLAAPERASSSADISQGTYEHAFNVDVDAVLAFVRARRWTLNAFLQAAWAIVLSQFSSKSDVAFGITVAGRPADLPSAEAIVGLFINSLPLRIHVNRNERLEELVRQVQLRQAELIEFQYTPLINIRQWSELVEGEPLFESLFVFENFGTGLEKRSEVDGLRVEKLGGVERLHYPLTLTFTANRILGVRVTFASARYQAEVITRLISQLERAVKKLMERPNELVENVFQLDEGERAEEIGRGRGAIEQYEGEECVHEWVSRCAQREGEGIALVDER